MGTCARNCVCRCSPKHCDDEYGTDFSQEQFAVGYLRQQCRSLNSFVAMVLLFPKLWAGNQTRADDDNRKQVDALKESKGKGRGEHQNHKGNGTNNTSNTSNTDINTCKYCGRTGHWAKDCWRPGAGAHDNSTSNNMLHTERQESQFHACPIKYTGKKCRCLILEDGQFECFSMRVRFKNPSWCRGTGVITLTRSRRNTVKHSCKRERESLFFAKGMLVAPLLTTGVSDEVAQELQMPIGPQVLDDVEEPMLARTATLRSGHSRSNRDGTAQSDTLSESAFV